MYNNNFKRGIVELLLFKMISEGDCYGYEITQTIKKLSNDLIVINSGTLYPIIEKMKNKGYISSYEVKFGKRQSKIYYHMESSGMEQYARMLEDYKEFADATMLVLNYKKKVSGE